MGYINKYRNRAGIYAIIREYNKEFELLYIGQSKNLAERLHTHSKKNNLENVVNKVIAERGKCNRLKAIAFYGLIKEWRDDICFYILEELDPTDEDYYRKIDELEEKYITEYQPPFNYLGVDVPYRPQWKGKKYD